MLSDLRIHGDLKDGENPPSELIVQGIFYSIVEVDCRDDSTCFKKEYCFEVGTDTCAPICEVRPTYDICAELPDYCSWDTIWGCQPNDFDPPACHDLVDEGECSPSIENNFMCEWNSLCGCLLKGQECACSSFTKESCPEDLCVIDTICDICQSKDEVCSCGDVKFEDQCNGLIEDCVWDPITGCEDIGTDPYSCTSITDVAECNYLTHNQCIWDDICGCQDYGSFQCYECSVYKLEEYCPSDRCVWGGEIFGCDDEEPDKTLYIALAAIWSSAFFIFIVVCTIFITRDLFETE